VSVPGYDPTAAGAAAIAMYDTNHDGVISGAELDQCPALKRALKFYDTGGDGKVTAANIAARIRKWQADKVGGWIFAIHVTLDGKPLEGATVTFDPEPFLGEAGQRLVAMTNPYGTASPTAESAAGTAGARRTIVTPPGLYKIRISKVTDGKETIPERYNTATELGMELASDNPETNGLKFNLSSK